MTEGIVFDIFHICYSQYDQRLKLSLLHKGSVIAKGLHYQQSEIVNKHIYLSWVIFSHFCKTFLHLQFSKRLALYHYIKT